MADSQIKSFSLEGRAGKLEALLNSGRDDATHVALVCHPHPLFGGTLHNKVVFHAMKALNSFGFPVLRFNFRGTGLSQGDHDHGRGEADDVRVALKWLKREFNLPIIFAGFSFGAAVGLRAACSDPNVVALISVGTPVAPIDDRSYDYSFLKECPLPKLFASGARDRYGPQPALKRLVDSVAPPKELVLIEAGDHFFEGRLAELRRAIENWVRNAVLQQVAH